MSDYNALGIVRTKSYRADAARGPLGTAAGLIAKLIERDPTSAKYASQSGAINNNLADAHRLLGNGADSERLLAEAVEQQELAIGRDPENAEYREFLANHLFNLGINLAARRDPKSGDVLGRALRERERLVQTEPSITQWQLDLARTYIELGKLPAAAFTEGAVDPQRMFEQAVACLERLLTLTPAWNDARSQLAQACHQLALTHLAQNRAAPALGRGTAQRPPRLRRSAQRLDPPQQPRALALPYWIPVRAIRESGRGARIANSMPRRIRAALRRGVAGSRAARHARALLQ